MTNNNILDTIPAHLLQLDDQGLVRDFYFADGIEGHPTHAQRNTNLSSLFPQEISNHYLHHIERLKAGDNNVSFVYVTTHNGDQYQFKTSGSRQNGDYLFIIQTTNQATHEKEEKEMLYEQIRKAQKMETLGRLSSGIAHDFNNILASILGYADLTLDVVSKQGQQELVRYINEVINEGEKARDLITQMLAFSRASQNEDIALNPTPLIKELAKVIQASLPANIDLTVHVDENIHKILISPSQLHQMILNICNNSREAIADKQGRITINLSNATRYEAKCSVCHQHFKGDFVEITIADDGEGINADLLENIFKPFYTSREKSLHSGMGLVVVNENVHEQRGHIVVDSIVGYGTTTRLFFPPAEQQQDAPTQAENQYCSHASILIVEDEETIANLQSELLQSKGFSTAAYSDAYKALSHLKSTPEKFDCIVIDQSMPSLSGIDFSKQALQLRPELPIILCTTNKQTIDHRTLDQLGIRGRLKKPFTSEQLIEEICKLVQNET